MGRPDGSSVNGGRKDEPDLPVGNTGMSFKNGCSNESDKSKLFKQLRIKVPISVFFLGFVPFKRLLQERPVLVDRLLTRPRLLERLLVRPWLLRRLIMEDDKSHLLEHLQKQPFLLMEHLLEPDLLGCLLERPDQLELVLLLLLKKLRMQPGLLELGVTYTDNTITTVSARPWPTEEGFLHISGLNHRAATNKIGNLASKEISMMSIRDDGGFGSDGTSATHTTVGNHQSGTDLATNHEPVVILDTGAEVNVTGDEAVFIPVLFEPEGFGLRAANGHGMASYFCGRLSHERYHMNYVYFSEDVGPRTIISGPELDLLGFSLKFEGGTCEVRDPETGFLVGEGRLVDNKKYLMDYLKIPLDRFPVQVPNVENVPLPYGPVEPLSVFTPLWTAIRTVLRRFSGSLFKQAKEQATRRPPV